MKDELRFPGDGKPLINRTAVRRLALYYAGRLRSAQGFRRVSAGFLDDIEREVHRAVRENVRGHPSRGKTLRSPTEGKG